MQKAPRQDEPLTDPPSEAAPEVKFPWRRLLSFALAFGAILFMLPLTQPAPEVNDNLTAQVTLRKLAGELDTEVGSWRAEHRKAMPEGEKLVLALRYTGPRSGEETLRRQLAGASSLSLEPGGQDGALVVVVSDKGGIQQQTVATLVPGKGEPSRELLKSARRKGSWVSVLPPLFAVLVALFFKRLLVALFGAVWLGAALQVGFMPHTATWDAVVKYMLGSTFDSFNLSVIGFTLSLVGMVHVILRMGGMAGLIEKIQKLATSRRASKLTTALMGGAIFFDDYANTIVVGSTMRPLTDMRRISREKLAYLVDSTSAPIAGVAIISTWIGYEVGLFDELSTQLSLGMSGYEIFFSILAMRFYCLLTLVFVLMNAFFERDFGPMLAAEVRAASGMGVLRAGSKPLTQLGASEHIAPKEGAPLRWYNAVIPVGTVIVAVMLGMYWSGWSGPNGASLPNLWDWAVSVEGASWEHLGAAAAQLGSWEAWRDGFSNADNAKVLFMGALLGSAVALGLAMGQRILSPREAVVSFARAVPGMWMAIAILVLAWSIRAVCDDLGTNIYLVGAVQDLLSVNMLPILTFGLAAVIAFSTGTSWGTMGR